MPGDSKRGPMACFSSGGTVGSELTRECTAVGRNCQTES